MESNETLKNELRTMVSEAGGISRDFDSSAHFYNELGIASVTALRLLMALEDKYSISIQDLEFVDATSLDNLSALIGRILQEQGAK
jgi:acyl carrier protein